MTINPAWEELFRTREWGKYPDLELVRFVMKRWPNAEQRIGTLVLELGCGTGANIKMLFESGFIVHGIDGSETALKKCWPYLDYYPNGSKRAICDDVANLGHHFGKNNLDLVCDVGCFMHQDAESRKEIVQQAFEVLRPGGWLFFSEAVSQTCSAYDEHKLGAAERPDLSLVSDEHFQPHIPYHFFTEVEFAELFTKFQNFKIEVVMRSYGAQRRWYDRYVVSGQKP